MINHQKENDGTSSRVRAYIRLAHREKTSCLIASARRTPLFFPPFAQWKEFLTARPY